MQVFRVLFLKAANSERLSALVDEVEKSLKPGWKRDRALEKSLRADVFSTKPVYCFAKDEHDRLPSATVYLLEETPGNLVLSNIIPRKQYQLTYDEYDSILEEFVSIVRPCADKNDVLVNLTRSQADLRDWLSNTAAEKLRTFSTRANKRAGFLLPSDEERWLDFIVTARREGSTLDASNLRRWLVEVEGWSPEIAEQLAGEYAFGGKLLTFSESRGVGA
jgi:hypothetical protein